MTRPNPILCLDFDGVLHSYTSRWQGADIVADPATPGAIEALRAYLEAGFQLQVFSSRSHQDGGLDAMKAWTQREFPTDIWAELGWPLVKPPALVTLDDRALTFTGVWPTVETLKSFRPWNKP